MSYYICRSVSINLSPSFAPYMHIVSVDIWQGGFYSKHTQMICGPDYGISLNCSPVVLWFEAPHQHTHGVGLEGEASCPLLWVDPVCQKHRTGLHSPDKGHYCLTFIFMSRRFHQHSQYSRIQSNICPITAQECLLNIIKKKKKNTQHIFCEL